MSYNAVPSEKSESCRCNNDPLKIREVAIKSITQRRMERNRELRQYTKKLISYVEEELDKETLRCGHIYVGIYVSTLTHIGRHDVPEKEVIRIVKDHYEPEYIVSTHHTTIGDMVDIVENLEAKSREPVHNKQTSHSCVLF